MIRKQELSEKWIKASVLGTTWAASEIVLGSFLHNLKIPFSSNILTAIGIIILISSNYKWREKGLFWRAGLICALMKSMSPSAVIFGPMIAIFSESLMMEFSVRLLGRTISGYVLGGMLAMSWNFFHRIMNLIIFYGSNIIDVYSDIVRYAQKQLSIHTDILWFPILILFALYFLMGLFAAYIGIKVGKKLLHQVGTSLPDPSIPDSPKIPQSKPVFSYSMTWLLANVFMIISGLCLLTYTNWYIWSFSIVAFTVIWIIRYKRALHQLSKPKFWIGFLLITMLTAFTFNTMQSMPILNGLMIGIEMNFRAVLIILGFSVIGTELYNPVIRAFFLRTSFRQLPLALELSFKSLPAMIARIPEVKELIKNPVGVIFEVLYGIEVRLEEIRKSLPNKIIIISGHIGQGKTTQVQKLVEMLRSDHVPVAGIFSPRIMKDEETIGYDIIDAATNKRDQFLRAGSNSEFEKIGKYLILPHGYLTGTEALRRSQNEKYKVIVIDEIGQLELNDKGWAKDLDKLFTQSKSNFILSVRDSFTDHVIKKWDLKNYVVFNLSESDDYMIRNYLSQTIR